MRHAGGRKESMNIQLGIAVLFACPGLKAGEARKAAAQFYGPKATIESMKAKIAEAGGYKEAGIAAFNRWNAAHPINAADGEEVA